MDEIRALSRARRGADDSDCGPSPPQLPPGPAGLALLPLGFRVARNPLQALSGLVERYGPVVRVGSRMFWMLWRPEHVAHVLVMNSSNYEKGHAVQAARSVLGNGLVMSDGEIWRQQRERTQSMFTTSAFGIYQDALSEAVDRMLDRWRPRCAGGAVRIDVAIEMSKLFRETMNRSLFGIEPDTAYDALPHDQDVLEKHIQKMAWNPFQWAESVPTPHNLRFRRAFERVHDLLQSLIDARRGSPDAEVRNAAQALISGADGSPSSLTDQQLREELMTLFFTGHATTACATSWTWHSLAAHPELMRRLVELCEGGDQGAATQFARRIAKEALRLYPPAWVIARTAKAEDRIGEFDVPAGMVLLLCTHVTHHHREFWPDPERFDPDRFLPERVAARPTFAYYPFGGGARACIGSRVAEALVAETLVRVLERFRVLPVPRSRTRPKVSTVLKPSPGVHIIIEERNRRQD